MPRTRKLVPEVPKPPALPMTLRFGIVAFRFSTFWRPRVSRPSPVIATMEMGTSWRFLLAAGSRDDDLFQAAGGRA